MALVLLSPSFIACRFYSTSDMDEPNAKVGQMVVLESALKPIFAIFESMTDPSTKEAIMKALAK